VGGFLDADRDHRNVRTGLEKIRLAAEGMTQKAVHQAGEPGPASVTVRAVSGLAAEELIIASREADLIWSVPAAAAGSPSSCWAR
jgi:hypothetical protein